MSSMTRRLAAGHARKHCFYYARDAAEVHALRRETQRRQLRRRHLTRRALRHRGEALREPASNTENGRAKLFQNPNASTLTNPTADLAPEPAPDMLARIEGHAHVGWPQLRQNRTIHKFHHGMNCGLGMDDDINFRERNIEKPASFDHFEAFVHQRGGIDGDALAHLPFGMVEGLFGSGVGDGRERSAAKWAAAGGEDQGGGLLPASFPAGRRGDIDGWRCARYPREAIRCRMRGRRPSRFRRQRPELLCLRERFVFRRGWRRRWLRVRLRRRRRRLRRSHLGCVATARIPAAPCWISGSLAMPAVAQFCGELRGAIGVGDRD